MSGVRADQASVDSDVASALRELKAEIWQHKLPSKQLTALDAKLSTLEGSVLSAGNNSRT